MPHPLLKFAPWIVTCSLCLTACGGTEPPAMVTRVQIEKKTVPASLLVCDDEPEPPKAGRETPRNVALWANDLRRAWLSCWAQIVAVRQLVEEIEPVNGE